MSFLFNDKNLLDSLLKIGKKEDANLRKKKAQNIVSKINSDPDLMHANAKNFFINSLNLLTGDQLSNDSGQQISIKIQDSPEELIKYLVDNKITIGNERVAIPFDSKQKYLHLDGSIRDYPWSVPKNSFITGNVIVRKDLLDKYLKILSKRYAKRPLIVKISDLIAKTESYVSSVSKNQFTVSKEKEESSDKKISDDTLLDLIYPEISKNNVAKNGQIPLHVGDLSDQDGLIKWIESNNQLTFVDEKQSNEKLTWEGSPEKTKEIKYILLDFLSKRSDLLNQRQAGKENREKNEVYISMVKSLMSTLFPGNNQSGTDQQKSINTQKINQILNTYAAYTPFDESDDGKYFSYRRVKSFVEEIMPLLYGSGLDNYYSVLNQHVNAYSGDYGGIDEIPLLQTSYHTLKARVLSVKPQEKNPGKYLENLKLFCSAINSCLGALKGYLQQADSYFKKNGMQDQVSEKIQSTIKSINTQMQYSDDFIGEANNLLRHVMYEG